MSEQLVPYEDKTQMVVHDSNVKNEDDDDHATETAQKSQDTTSQMVVYTSDTNNNEQVENSPDEASDNNGNDKAMNDTTNENLPPSTNDEVAPKKKKKKKKKVVEPPKEKSFLEKLLPDDDGKPPIIKDPYRQYRNHKCIFICLTISVIFAYTAILSCGFLKVGEDTLSYSELEDRGPFFQGQYSNGTKLGCVRYDPSVPLTAPLKWSQVGGGALMALITICWLMALPWFLFSSNVITKKFLHLMLRICIPICLIINIFVLVKMNGISECSEDGSKCAPGIAAIVAIINVFLLIYMTIMMFLIPAPTLPVFLVNDNLPRKEPDPEFVHPSSKKSKKKKTDDDEEPHKDDIVETTIEVLPTGTKKTHYITHPDGTQSVKEEFIPKSSEIV